MNTEYNNLILACLYLLDHLFRFMPCLKYMIGNATTQELRLLRGKTIECVSLIGLAVGGEKFSADASEVSID